jgi:hypothetical protein
MTRVITGHWPLREVTLLAAVFLACAGPAVPAAAQDRLDHRVSLDLKAMAPRDAFNVIAAAILYTVEVAPDVTTPVDIVVDNVRARTALDTICDSIGCAWEAKGEVIHVRRQPPTGPVVHRGRLESGSQASDPRGPATAAEWKRRLEQPLPPDMKFERAPLSEVAERLGKATGFEVSFLDDTRVREAESLKRKLADARARLGARHPDVLSLERQLASAAARVEPLGAATGSITADLGGQPLRAALSAIGEQLEAGAVCRLMFPGQAGRGGVAFGIGKPRRPAK